MSEFWQKKMKTYFNRFDYNGDGVLTEKDYDLWATRFADAENASPEEKEALRRQLRDAWACEYKSGDSNEPFTCSAMMESMKVEFENPEYKKMNTDIMMSLLKIMDVNHDGHISPEEWSRFFLQLGVNDTKCAKRSFEQMDVNHDGKLSFEEVCNAFLDFLLLQDENSPNSEFFGPLD